MEFPDLVVLTAESAFDILNLLTGTVDRSGAGAGGANTMLWNTQGQLVSVSTNGAFAESYAYDPPPSTRSATRTVCPKMNPRERIGIR